MSKKLFGLAVIAVLVTVGFTSAQAQVTPYCSVSQVEFDPLLETPDFYPPVLKVKIETVGNESDFMFLADAFGVEVLSGFDPLSSASGLIHEFQLPEGDFNTSITPQENYTVEYPDCGGIALRNGTIVEYVAVATYQEPLPLITTVEEVESKPLTAPYCSVSQVEFDPLLETPDFYPPVLKVSIEGDTDADGFGISLLNNLNPFAFELGISRQFTLEEGPFQVDIQSPENYKITSPTCSEPTLRNGTIVSYVALSTYEEPADPTPEPNVSSGSSRSHAPAGNGGLVLGAGAINWNALTDAEKAELLAPLFQRLQEIIRLFEEYKAGLAH